MINNILNTKDSIRISEQLRNQKKRIVLVGGCFDILHVGHVRFLQSAKKQGEILFVLLESDENVHKLKGNDRPLNSQNDRAEILSSLKPVDYVVLLRRMKSNKDYDKLITLIGPSVLATTKNDPAIVHKIRQAKMINAKVKEVIVRLDNSSSDLVKNMSSEK